ncbi:hypothetical protein Tco_1516104 [Tanacetum coccineum]
MVITNNCIILEIESASPEQTATGKDKSNPFLAVMTYQNSYSTQPHYDSKFGVGEMFQSSLAFLFLGPNRIASQELWLLLWASSNHFTFYDSPLLRSPMLVADLMIEVYVVPTGRVIATVSIKVPTGRIVPAGYIVPTGRTSLKDLSRAETYTSLLVLNVFQSAHLLNFLKFHLRCGFNAQMQFHLSQFKSVLSY